VRDRGAGAGGERMGVEGEWVWGKFWRENEMEVGMGAGFRIIYLFILSPETWHVPHHQCAHCSLLKHTGVILFPLITALIIIYL
jgi:hypothetical protein